MSISNLLVPNEYDLFCKTITATSEIVSGDLDITGNLTVAGSSTLQATTATTLSTSNSITSGIDLTVTRNAGIGQDLDVTRNTGLHGTLTVDDTTSLGIVTSSGLASLHGVAATNRMTQLAGRNVSSPITDMAVIETGTDQNDAITAFGANHWSYASFQKSHAIAYSFGASVGSTGPLTINGGSHFETSDLVIGATTYTLNSGLRKSYLVQASLEFTLDNGESIDFELISSGSATPIRSKNNNTSNTTGADVQYNKTFTGLIDVADTETPTISINVNSVTGNVSLSSDSTLTIIEL